MAHKSNSKHKKQQNKENSGNGKKAQNFENTGTNSKKHVILKRKQKPLACVQPQPNLNSTSTSSSTSNSSSFASDSTSLTAEVSVKRHLKNIKKRNTNLYQGQPLLHMSTPLTNYVSLPSNIQQVQCQPPFTCPVMNWNSSLELRLASRLIYSPPINLPVAIPLLMPAQIFPQLLPVIPVQTDAEIIFPGVSVLPSNNINFLDSLFSYSKVWSPLHFSTSTCSFCTCTINSFSQLNSSESCLWQNALSVTDDTATTSSISESVEEIITQQNNPLDFYLSLPEDLFPKARMLSVDPNPIIDVFCKVSDIDDYEPWLLDLEYGVPRAPVTRPIAIYDVQYNRIHCKNTPGAIHPGFENCSTDFKRVVMFYYDCIISTWYRGYTIMYFDVSVANYQTWLRPPMQVFGMCWP